MGSGWWTTLPDAGVLDAAGSVADDIATEVATALGSSGGYLLRSAAFATRQADCPLTWEDSTDLLARALASARSVITIE